MSKNETDFREEKKKLTFDLQLQNAKSAMDLLPILWMKDERSKFGDRWPYVCCDGTIINEWTASIVFFFLFIFHYCVKGSDIVALSINI